VALMVRIEPLAFGDARRTPQGTFANGEPAPGVLIPDFAPCSLPSGTTRDPDVRQFRGDDGPDWITNEGGTSLFDRDGVFAPNQWATFKIPKGMVVSEGIGLKEDGGVSD
jgi:Tse2 ADP-ribosyltransferase toxins